MPPAATKAAAKPSDNIPTPEELSDALHEAVSPISTLFHAFGQFGVCSLSGGGQRELDQATRYATHTIATSLDRLAEEGRALAAGNPHYRRALGLMEKSPDWLPPHGVSSWHAERTRYAAIAAYHRQQLARE